MNFLNSQPKTLKSIHTSMTGLLLTVALLLLPCTDAWAAELNITQNQLPVNLGPYLDSFEDPERALTIEQMTSESIQFNGNAPRNPSLRWA